MLNRFWQRGVDADTVGLWFDRLYRIKLEDLQEFLARHHHVKIVGLTHEFGEPPTKLGAKGRLVLVEFPDAFTEPGKLVAQRQCISVCADENTCLLSYSTSRQTLRAAFRAAGERGIRAWCKEVRRDPPFYAAMLLYVVNRFRASRAIEEDQDRQRKFLAEFNRRLRDEDADVHETLEQLARASGCDWVAVFVCNQIEEYLVPFASSKQEVLRRLREVPLASLACHEELFGEGAKPLVAMTIPKKKQDCNCRVFYKLGARWAAYVPFGWEPVGSGRPRGILGFYRTRPPKLEEEDSFGFLRIAGREIAAWVNENDELVERQIVERSIETAEENCRMAERHGLDESLLSSVLRGIEEHLHEALSSLPLYAAKEAPLRVGLYVNGKVTGAVPKDLQSRLAQIRKPTLVQSDSGEGAVAWCEPSPAFCLVILGPRTHLGLLRGRLYESLYLFLRLVHRLILVEQRRTVWTLHTIHEVRQPLQGLVAIADEITRISGLSSVSRSEIGHWAEDMATGVQRLKVLLRFSEHIAGIERIVPNPREMLLEADVLRVVRRLLSGLARGRKLQISEAIGYEQIPEVTSDPELLTEIFYNLIQNAIKYSRPDTEIRITCGRSERDYYVDIENDGAEIFDHEREDIFVDGYRGRNASKIEGGMGMGLPVSRVLAAHIGCRLELVSRGAAGSSVVFRVYLPEGDRP